MRFFLISDNSDAMNGLRLAGIEGTVARSEADLRKALENAANQPDIAVLLVTEKIAETYTEVLDAVRAAKTPRAVLNQARDFFSFYSTMILRSFGELATGKTGVDQLTGPVGTVAVVRQAISYGWQDVVSLMALLTINIGIFNLLPIPALDGCKLLFLAFECLTGRTVPLRAQAVINTAGLLALMGLMLFVTMQDVIRIF